MLTNASSNTPSIRDLLAQNQWEEVVSILRDEEFGGERASKICSDGWTVLHGLMQSYGQGTPAIESNVLGDVIDNLLDTLPGLLRSEFSALKGDLPLHSAVRYKLPLPLIAKLICGYPESVDTKNSAGSYPRDLCEQGSYGNTWNARYLEAALLCLLKCKEWKKASEFLETEKGRRSVKVDATLMTAINDAAPNPLLRALVIAYPDALKKQVEGELPLRCAIEANASPEIIELMIRLHPCALDRKGAEKKSGRCMALDLIPRSTKNSDLLKLIEKPTSYWKAMPMKDAEELKQAKSKIAKLEQMVSSSEARQKKTEEKQREIGNSKDRLSRTISALRKQNDGIRKSEQTLISIVCNGPTASSSELREVVSSLNDRLDRLDSIEATSTSKTRTLESDLVSSAVDDCNTPSQYLLKLLAYVSERIADAETKKPKKASLGTNGVGSESSRNHASKKRKVAM